MSDSTADVIARLREKFTTFNIEDHTGTLTALLTDLRDEHRRLNDAAEDAARSREYRIESLQFALDALAALPALLAVGEPRPCPVCERVKAHGRSHLTYIEVQGLYRRIGELEAAASSPAPLSPPSTPQDVDAVESDIDGAFRLLWTMSFDQPNARDAIGRIQKHIAALSKGVHRGKLFERAYDRLALCPDHRDKATGRCIVCDGEKRGREEAPSPVAPPVAGIARTREALTLAVLAEAWAKWNKGNGYLATRAVLEAAHGTTTKETT